MYPLTSHGRSLEAVETAMQVLSDAEKQQLNRLLRTIDRSIAGGKVWEGQ